MTTLTDSPSATDGDPALWPSAALSDELLRFRVVIERTGAQLAARRRQDLDKAAYAVLFHLANDGPRRSGALAERMFADPSTVSRHVAQLVGRGLVERTPDPDDGRATLVALTEFGQQTAAAFRRHRRRLSQVVVNDWDIDEIQTFTRLLARFSDDLEQHRPTLLADVLDSLDLTSDLPPAPGDLA